MKSKHPFLLFLSISALLLLASCQKVINVDLNSAAPAIVIEGGITDQPGPYTVTLTSTVSFSSSNTFPPVSGAAVTIADNAGHSDILTETSPGIYSTSSLQGVPGRVYTLTVIASNKTYQSVSTLSPPVSIDSLSVIKSGSFGGGPGGPGGKSINVSAKFTDPAGTPNYYRFTETINHILTNSIFITSDNLRDATVIDYTLRTNSDFKLHSLDTVDVELRTIDLGVYEYFRTFNRTGGGAFGSSSPANPLSNISGGALGYFSAYSVRPKRIIIP